MSRRVLLLMAATVLVAAIGVGVWALTRGASDCGTDSANSSSHSATSTDPSYWTEERMRGAAPAPMPTGSSPREC